jgi:uncharacterized protein (TIRG00374 family)
VTKDGQVVAPSDPAPGRSVDAAGPRAGAPDQRTGATVQADGDHPAGDASRPVVRRGRLRGLLRATPRPVRHLVRLGILLLIIEYLVLPQIAGTRKAIHLLGAVNGGWLALGVVLEALALVAYSQLTRAVLPPSSDPGLATVLRIQLTTLSVSHCVPGGSAAGSSLGYRLFTNSGAGGPEVGFAMATQSLGSAVVLNTIFWVALVVSIPVWGLSPLYASAAIVGVIVVGAFTALLLLLTRGEDRAVNLLNRLARHLPRVDERSLERLFRRMADRVRQLAAEPRLLVRAVAWAAANWLLDAASLLVFVGAFGHWVNPDALLVSYGLANVLAAIPITPGGLGVVETVLTSTLVGFGTPRGIAILGVLGYRLFNFWAPIPIGGVTYLSLQVRPGETDLKSREARRRARREALSRFVEVVGTSQQQHLEAPVDVGAEEGAPENGATEDAAREVGSP